MLARPETRRCIECGLPYSTNAFWYHEGRPENGPAYWSDRGIICSPACSLTHFKRRQAEGTLLSEPAANPFDIDSLFRR